MTDGPGAWLEQLQAPKATITSAPAANARRDHSCRRASTSVTRRMSDFIGSTSAIIDWCVKQPASEFIVMTESGVRYSLERLAPAKKFYFVANENCNCSECPYMKRNTLEKLRDALLHLEPRVELSPEILENARRPVERMLALR